MLIWKLSYVLHGEIVVHLENNIWLPKSVRSAQTFENSAFSMFPILDTNLCILANSEFEFLLQILTKEGIVQVSILKKIFTIKVAKVLLFYPYKCASSVFCEVIGTFLSSWGCCGCANLNGLTASIMAS